MSVEHSHEGAMSEARVEDRLPSRTWAAGWAIRLGPLRAVEVARALGAFVY